MKLSKPITAHGEELTEIALREPSGKDAREIKGVPYWVSGDGAMTLNTDVAAKYISRLAAIPMSSVDQLAPVDIDSLSWEVAGYFLNGK